MAKKPSSLERIRRQAARDPKKFQHDELVSVVCKYFCRGMPVTQIAKTVREKMKIELSREEPYRLISFAAQRQWLRYQAPLALDISEEIMKRHPWLHVKVFRTGVSDDISYQLAETLLELVCELGRLRSPNAEVHIGFAGGISLRKTARMFAEKLKEPRENLPKKIVFHAVVAGFNITDPSTDPNGFFTYFAGDSALLVKTAFMGLPAPGIAFTSEMGKLRSNPYMSKAIACIKDIDIVVTSVGGHFQEGHSGFHSMFSTVSPRTVEQLIKAGCIGDMSWRPLGKEGPLEVKTEMRTVTLLELGDLPQFIKRGKSVLLLVGPCGDCGGPKDEVLRAIFAKDRLISHLVVDSRSATGLLA